jgi:hypothetical protein
MDAPGLVFRPYQLGDEHGILATFNRVFGEVCGASFVDRDLAFWRWQFLRNPAGTRVHLGVAADGTVAAQYAALPARARTPAGPTIFGQIVDSFTHPDYRKGLKAPGAFILNALPATDDWFAGHGDGMLYGYPVRTAERMGQRYLEYRVVRIVDYLVRDLNDVPGPRPVGPSSVRVERVSSLPRDIDALAGTFATERRCLLERGVTYLAWRYLDCPTGGYEVFTARRDELLAGVMVLRPDACTIADWMVPRADAEVADALLAVAALRGKQTGRRLLLAVFPDHAPEHAWACARGFSIVPSADTLERRLTYRINQPGLTFEMLRDLWYYTLGDSDLV